MANSCSHWWHAPFYIIMSIALAFVAVTTMIHPRINNSTISIRTLKHDLSMNASKVLRAHGFHIMATFLQISPDLFLSSPESTIFAIQDSAIRNVSTPLHPWLMKQLLQYHTSPSVVPMQELLKKPQGSCLRTLVDDKPIKITKNDEKMGVVEINNVLISHPDMFLEGSISVHGVLGPFSSLDLGGIDQDWDFIHSPACESNLSVSSNTTESQNLVEWPWIIRLLSANRFVPFAIGLHSVLDGIVQDCADLSSVTIFAPTNFPFIASPSPMLDRIVRLHIVTQRFTYRELALLPENSSLSTLVPDKDLDMKMNKFSQVLAIDDVEITAPDVFSSNNFIIHGISRALSVEEISGAI